MLYSVWNPHNHTYSYYQVEEAFSSDGPLPRPRSGTRIGHAPEDASWQLPASAKLIGQGEEAKGAVVHPGSLSGLDDVMSSPLILFVGLGIAYLFLRGDKF
jgi:hypothetical protein